MTYYVRIMVLEHSNLMNIDFFETTLGCTLMVTGTEVVFVWGI